MLLAAIGVAMIWNGLSRVATREGPSNDDGIQEE
jgi:hypothetical protein